MSWIKDNGGILGVVTGAMIAAGGYSELRIRAEVPERVTAAVNEKLKDIQAVTPDRMKAAEGDIIDLKDADNRMDDKITRIIDILLED